MRIFLIGISIALMSGCWTRSTHTTKLSDDMQVGLVNSKLQSLSADVEIILATHRLMANIYCAKPRDYRLIIKNEADVGCNQQHFWYWFRRRNPDTVFYEVYEKASFTNIPINPVWLSECFNLVNITGKSVRNGTVVRKKGDMLFVTIFDKEMIKGHYVYDSNNDLTAFCDIKKTAVVDGFHLPLLMVLSYPKEQIHMEWRISNYKTNIKHNKDTFVIPNKPQMKLIH